MTKKFLAVLGWFAQPGLILKADPSSGGVGVAIDERHTVYDGAFTLHSETTFDGRIFDKYGIGEIHNGKLESHRITFDKVYTHRQDIIKYDVIRYEDSALFIGTFSGSLVGEGHTRLLIIPTPREFFD